MDAVRTNARNLIRQRLITATSKTTRAAEIDLYLDAVLTALDQQSAKSLTKYTQKLQMVCMNIDRLGTSVLQLQPPARIVAELKQDREQLRAALEADVRERRIVDEFAASEECVACGLPRSNPKYNVNRLDVEDEVFGQQYDAVFANDICRCSPEEIADAERAQQRREDETVEEAKLRREKEEKQKELEEEAAQEKTRQTNAGGGTAAATVAGGGAAASTAATDTLTTLWDEQEEDDLQERGGGENDDDDAGQGATTRAAFSSSSTRVPQRRAREE